MKATRHRLVNRLLFCFWLSLFLTASLASLHRRMVEPSSRSLLSQMGAALGSLSIKQTNELVVHLGVELKTIDDIDYVHRGGSKLHSIQAWLDHDIEASWKKLVCGLQEMKMYALARKVAKKHCPELAIASCPSTEPSSPESVTAPSHLVPALPSSATTGSVTATHLPITPPSNDRPQPMAMMNVAAVSSAQLQLKNRFSKLVSRTRIKMCARESQNQEFLDEFRDHLLLLPITKKAIHVKFFRANEDEILEARNVRKLIAILSRYLSFCNYEILREIIVWFGVPQLVQRMQEYCGSLKNFEMTTTVDVYIIAVPEEVTEDQKKAFSKMVVRIKKPASQCTLFEVRKLNEDIATGSGLSPYCVYTSSVNDHCVEVTLQFPTCVAGFILATLTPDFMEHHLIINVTLDGNSLTTISADRGRLVIPTETKPEGEATKAEAKFKEMATNAEAKLKEVATKVEAKLKEMATKTEAKLEVLEEAVLPKALDRKLSPDDTKDVLDRAWKARKKWYFIGVRFGLPVSELDIIEKNNPNDIDEQFKSMIKKWLERGENCTWRAIYDALNHRIVGQNLIAKELIEWLMTTPYKGRKRKAAGQDGGEAKKMKLDESTVKVVKGCPCPVKMHESATALNGCAYFQSEDGSIHQFNVTTRRWTGHFKSNRCKFGLAGAKNELVVVGGVINGRNPTNTLSSFSLKYKEWEEKYPPMHKARVRPEVVVFDHFLIVIGGFDANDKAILSIEVLDLDNNVWKFNDKLVLPNEFSSMKWFSACISGTELYVTAKHDDPQCDSTVRSLIDKEDEYDIDPDPCPCYSLYYCSVEVVKGQSGVLQWQPSDHPHPSVYDNDRSDAYDQGKVNLDQVGDELETSSLQYDACRFSLASVDERLIAVGCNHIKAINSEKLQESLEAMYYDYREKCMDCNDDFEQRDRDDIYDFEYEEPKKVKVSEDVETITEECHIFTMDTDDSYKWKFVTKTDRNGTSDFLPSVVVVDNILVVVRSSKAVHMVTFPK